ncbi:MAG TPA: hypothetical protein VEL31_06435, partial [Ktedonobacteraceae bacterium]|nr:hypothetical protein [Ktedonobacteraceae bacterium]
MQITATVTQKPETGQTPFTHGLKEMGAQNMEARELAGSHILCEALVREGVELLYGYPGGAI